MDIAHHFVLQASTTTYFQTERSMFFSITCSPEPSSSASDCTLYQLHYGCLLFKWIIAQI